MKTNYLFPNRFKKLGWIVLIPSSLLGFLALVFEFEPEVLKFRVPALFIDEIFGAKQWVGMVENNLFNEIIGVLVIMSSLLVAFSKEKLEDEFIAKIRLESLVWAVYINYAVLLIAFVCIYDMSFFWVMLYNLFTVLLIFIIRFHWLISKLNKSTSHEE